MNSDCVGSSSEPVLTVVSGPVKLAAYRFGGKGEVLLMAHATGFCGGVMQPLASHLSETFECVAFDERAHGSSEPPPDGDFDWQHFGEDVLAVVNQLELEHAYGLGHSCGGAALLMAEIARPGTFQGLYCFEPVIYPSDAPLEPSLEDNPLSQGALRRRRRFTSREEAYKNFSSKPPFDRLSPDALWAYVECGFAEDDQGVVLRCDPENEAQVYAHGFSHDTFSHLREVKIPVVLACGSETDAFGEEILSMYADRLASPTVVVLDGLTHFGPLEDPEMVAASVKETLLGRP
jgi:pimeloyl-ACP methyl ester carboxylesterase